MTALPKNKTVIQALNAVLGELLIAINQYFLHARIYRNEALSALDKVAYRQSIVEMKDADDLINRILLLGGLPNLQDLGKLLIGEDVKERLECDLKLEGRKVDLIRQSILVCEEARDFVSRALLKSLLDKAEEQADFWETQLELLEQMGIQNYIQMSAK